MKSMKNVADPIAAATNPKLASSKCEPAHVPGVVRIVFVKDSEIGVEVGIRFDLLEPEVATALRGPDQP